MANFNLAFDLTMEIEGGYSNNPHDAGGETYRGISRRFHPSWPGWAGIDTTKAKTDTPHALDDALKNNTILNSLVKTFYKESFWDRFAGDSIPDNNIAGELFDQAVNIGVHKAVGFLQSALNLLNRNQADYRDIIEDGVFGSGTMDALNSFLQRNKNNGVNTLLKLMNTLQGMHYIDIARKNSSQEVFLHGWLKRG